MDDDDNLPSVVLGDDANSTAESSVSHSFYSNSLFNMVRHEDISDDDFLHRLRMKNSHRDNSSASAMVTNELMMASHRHKLQRLDDDMTYQISYNDKEDDEIQNLLRMAKRLEIEDPGVSSDASAFSSRKFPMTKQIDPPEENGTEPGMTSQTNSRNKMYIASKPRNRYRRMNTDENQKIHAQNSTCIDSKQQCNRRYTDPCCNDEEQIDMRKPDPIETGSPPSNRTRTFSDEDSLIEFARRMSNSIGIEDTSSIEGPNDKECWANSSHSSDMSDGNSGGNRAANSHGDSSEENHVYDDEKKQQTGNTKGSKMKGLFHLISGKSNRQRGIRRPARDRSRSSRSSRRSRSSKRSRCSSFSLSSNYSRHSSRSRRTRDRSRNSRSSGSLSSNYSRQSSRNGIRRRARDRRRSSRSNSRNSRTSNSMSSKRSRCSGSSRSSNYSRQSSRRSVNSSYSSSSRRRMQNMKDTSMLTVAEAVAYLNKKEQFSSKKNSASRMSSTSRKSLRSAVSSKSYGRENNTVSKVVSAASGLKEKIRHRVVSKNAD